MHTRRDIVRAGLAASAALGLGWTEAEAQAEPEAFKAADGTVVAAERGAFQVPEDRRDPNARLITLRYVRFRATAPNPGYPLVYLAGGPGGSGIGAARGPRFPLFMALREVGDVIALDQRGTGASNAIPPGPAPGEGALDLTGAGQAAYFRREFRRCWDHWRSLGVSIAGYNTVQSAHDLEDLRRVLGAAKLNLWGISYGSHLAMATVKLHRDRIERVALASLEGLDQTVKRPSRADDYLAMIAERLRSEPATAAAYPDLVGMMRRVHERLDHRPAEIKGPFGPKGAERTVRLGAYAAQCLTGSLIKNPASLARLPKYYRLLDAGDRDTLAKIASRMSSPDQPITGMGEVMDLASGISPGRLAVIRTEAREALLGDTLNFPMPQLLGVVPGADLGEGFRSPLATDVPALLMSGSLDGRINVPEQAESVAQFYNRTWLSVENAGHDLLETTPEVARRMVAFFKGQPVDPTPIVLPPPTFDV